MASITGWTRIEPRSRDATLATTLTARLYDPLWLLARHALGLRPGDERSWDVAR